jgi:hypothetical protein
MPIPVFAPHGLAPVPSLVTTGPLPEPPWDYDWITDPKGLWMTYRYSTVLAQQFINAIFERYAAAFGYDDPSYVFIHPAANEGQGAGSVWLSIIDAVGRLAQSTAFVDTGELPSFTEHWPDPIPSAPILPGGLRYFPPLVGYPDELKNSALLLDYPMEVEATDSQWDHSANRAAVGEVARIVPYLRGVEGTVYPPPGGYGRLHRWTGTQWTYAPDAYLPTVKSLLWKPAVLFGPPTTPPNDAPFQPLGVATYYTPRLLHRLRDEINRFTKIIRWSHHTGGLPSLTEPWVNHVAIVNNVNLHGSPASNALHLEYSQGLPPPRNLTAVPYDGRFGGLAVGVEVSWDNWADYPNGFYPVDWAVTRDDPPTLFGDGTVYGAEPARGRFIDATGNAGSKYWVATRYQTGYLNQFRADSRTVGPVGITTPYPAEPPPPPGQFYGPDRRFGNGFYGGVFESHTSFGGGGTADSLINWAVAPPHSMAATESDGTTFYSHQWAHAGYWFPNPFHKTRRVSFYVFASRTGVQANYYVDFPAKEHFFDIMTAGIRPGLTSVKTFAGGYDEDKLTPIGDVTTAEVFVQGPVVDPPRVTSGDADGIGTFVDHWWAVEDYGVANGFKYQTGGNTAGAGWPPAPRVDMSETPTP